MVCRLITAGAATIDMNVIATVFLTTDAICFICFLYFCLKKFFPISSFLVKSGLLLYSHYNLSQIFMQKSELLSTIETLFWEHSFSDLSMDRIALELGMKKPSLYYHFPSKEAMFLSVLDQSFETYKVFMENTLEIGDINEMIAKLILFPLQTKNLFAIASQKGYCQMDDIRNTIEAKYQELETEKVRICQNRFGWNPARTKLFFALIEGLSKKVCLENCEGEKKEEMIGEIRRLFFGT